MRIPVHITLHRQQMKSAMLPIAMIGGALFYKWMGYLTFLSPYLIFLMLFITYCRLDLRDIKPTRAHLLLLAAQMAMAAAAYFLIAPFSHTVAEGVFICIFIPTATAAPVITAMLGGSISFVATYSLLCNAVVAVAGPFILAWIGDNVEIGFMQSMLLILKKVAPLLLLPLVAAILLKGVSKKAYGAIRNQQSLSFYIWAVALFIVVGSCVSFIINHWEEDHMVSMILMVVGALVACVAQFAVGRRCGVSVGRYMRSLHIEGHHDEDYDFRVSCAQSLMQKNTVLGVWIAMTYMNPLASVAPAAYIAWHNIVNSWQIFRHENGKKK